MATPYVIGLTGNIASGKSLVASLLRERGAEVIDADEVAHRLYEPGTSTTEAIGRQFGDRIIAPNGAVDRAALGAIVFGDPTQMSALEAIVHPAVRSAIRAWLSNV